ncbi:MAG: hypothetical protein NT070_11255 [Cyanobacteria bacterium]|nr:hypothetical protein [Cyanobacteriota bacterium]
MKKPIFTNLEKIIKAFKKFYKLSSINLEGSSANHQSELRSNIKNLGYEYARSLLRNLKIPDNLSPIKVGLEPKACQQQDIESAWFAYWCQQMKIPVVYHRKMWEFCYILQVMHEYDLLKPKLRGLGFGCGEEPLPSLLASYDIEITATELDPQESASKGWVDTNQSMSSVEKIWLHELCSQELFKKKCQLEIC